jgi:hypothetical protein
MLNELVDRMIANVDAFLFLDANREAVSQYCLIMKRHRPCTRYQARLITSLFDLIVRWRYVEGAHPKSRGQND